MKMKYGYNCDELVKMLIDIVAEEYGEKSVDKVDVEGLVDACLLAQEACVEKMIDTAREQAELKSSRIVRIAKR
jgi:hypothetical protein